MNPIEQNVKAGKIVDISWGDRWQVYYRLQELEIKSECASNHPLQVEVNTVKAAVQLWSVVRQLTANRRDLVRLLERCWQTDYYPQKD